MTITYLAGKLAEFDELRAVSLRERIAFAIARSEPVRRFRHKRVAHQAAKVEWGDPPYLHEIDTAVEAIGSAVAAACDALIPPGDTRRRPNGEYLARRLLLVIPSAGQPGLG